MTKKKYINDTKVRNEISKKNIRKSHIFHFKDIQSNDDYQPF